ncbi:MAG: hypothetical protein IH840_02320 [Candidatus Heimdallarchaeota archaeon]|nr:hypothetical protein [Candidatus Heimdallarchaeota archaeon]
MTETTDLETKVELSPKLKKSSQEALHLNFYLVTLTSFLLAYQLFIILSSNQNRLITFLVDLVPEYYFETFIVISMLIYTRLILYALPILQIRKKTSMRSIIITSLILTQPYVIVFTNNSFDVYFDLFAAVDERQFDLMFFWLIKSAIYFFGIVIIVDLCYTKQVFEGDPAFLKYSIMVKEFFLLIALILTLVFFLQSFFSASISLLEFTLPVKIAILVLYAFSTLPKTETVK